MAECGMRLTCEHGSHLAGARVLRRVAQQVDAPMNRVKSPDSDPMVDRARAEAQLEQLLARYDPVVAGGEPCHRSITLRGNPDGASVPRMLSAFASHDNVNPDGSAAAPGGKLRPWTESRSSATWRTGCAS